MWSCLDTISQRCTVSPEQVVQGVVWAGKSVGNFAERAIVSLAKLTRGSDECDMTLRFVSEGFSLWDLATSAEKATRPIITNIGSIRYSFSVTRVVRSLNYIVSGELYRDFVRVRVAPFVTEVAFIFARTLNAVQWCAEQKLFNFDSLANVAGRVGGGLGVAFVNKLRSSALLDFIFLVAISGLMYQECEAVNNGQVSWARLLSIASLTADVVAISLSLVGMTNPLVLSSLGLVAAGLGIASYFAPARTI